MPAVGWWRPDHHLKSCTKHEFRTPLSVIQGFTEQLQKKNFDPEQQQQLSLMKKNSKHLLHLLNNLRNIVSNALRLDKSGDGQSRLLWVIAPVIQVEADL